MKKTISIIALILLVSFQCLAQGSDRVGRTWKGPDISSIWGLLKEDEQNTRAKPATTTRVSLVKFTPAGDSGVISALADTLGNNPQQRASLAQAFAQIKQGYEAEVAKQGKSNNLAAALTRWKVSLTSGRRISSKASVKRISC